MAKMMSIALPVIALGAAAFTGGSSLGLLGMGAGDAAAADAGIGGVWSAATAGAMDASAGAELPILDQVGNAFTSIAGSSSLKALSLGGQLGGTIMQAVGAKEQGDQQQTLANFQAAQDRQNANNDMAVAGEEEQQQNKETAYVLSNAAAASAASGGAVTDPSTQNVMQTIAGQGRLRALTDMYNGQAKAQADTTQAAATEYGGVLAQQKGNMSMYGDILSGGSSLYDKYADLYNN